MTETQSALAEQALTRATTSPSLINYVPIFEAFMSRGIPESEIRPRENVFTFHAWRALGRTVRRGEKGVQVLTWVPITRKDDDTGEPKTIGKRPKTAYVFHISQTEPLTR